MSLANEQQLQNTQYKLSLLEKQIAIAEARPHSPEDAESIASLVRMANQLREEIVRFRSQHKRRGIATT